MSISDRLQKARQTLFNNLQVRRYYGKKYYRSASAGSSSRTQTRYIINQARSGQSRPSESEAGAGKGKENEVINLVDIEHERIMSGK